eukprot:SM000178S03461  [mRNA]  locus=s178:233724:234762:+ [translate_table: standard]
MGLSWAQVLPRAPVRKGARLCVCGKAVTLWTLNPLEVLYEEETKAPSEPLPGVYRNRKALLKVTAGRPERWSYSFAHGTVDGHFLAGEERFRVEWDQKDDLVYYDIYSFSKPANLLSVVMYPLVRRLQQRFARDSIELVKDTLALVSEDAARGHR